MPLSIDEHFARPRFHIVVPDTPPLASESHFWSPCPLIAGRADTLEFSVSDIFSLYADYQNKSGQLSHAAYLRLQAEFYFAEAQVFLHFGAQTEVTNTHGFDYPVECKWPGVLPDGHVLSSNLLLNLCGELLRRGGKTAVADRIRDIANSVHIDSEYEIVDRPDGFENCSIMCLRLLDVSTAERAKGVAIIPLDGSFDIDPLSPETRWSESDPAAYPYRAYEVLAKDVWPEDEFEQGETCCIVIGKGHVFSGELSRTFG